MTPDRERLLRTAMVRALQAMRAADEWRREAAKCRDQLHRLLADAARAHPDTDIWPPDLAAVLHYEREFDPDSLGLNEDGSHDA